MFYQLNLKEKLPRPNLNQFNNHGHWILSMLIGTNLKMQNQIFNFLEDRQQ